MEKRSTSQAQYWVTALGLFLLFAPFFLFGQDLSQVQSTVQQQSSPVKSIVKTVIDLIFAAGAIGVIGAFVAKREDAKQWLISYLVAIVVWAVIRTLFFSGT